MPIRPIPALINREVLIAAEALADTAADPAYPDYVATDARGHRLNEAEHLADIEFMKTGRDIATEAVAAERTNGTGNHGSDFSLAYYETMSAATTGDTSALRAALIQSAALAQQWASALDRR